MLYFITISAMGKKQLSNEDFKEKFINQYGDYYGLEELNYINYNKKVTIKCPEHGYKKIYPSNLFRSYMPPCLDCKNKLIGFYIVDTESFIKKANIIHNNKYDYKNTIYKDNKTPIIVTCYKHGDFQITVDGHIGSERGCPLCAKDNVRLTDLELINKFKKIHNNKYNYPNFKHNTVYDFIKIECPDHGIFEQKAMIHLRGHGCSKCANIVYSTKDFIEKSKEKYKDKFIYDNTIYTKYNEPIKIKCKIHGEYITTPSNHFLIGCGLCNKDTQNINYLYDFIKKANIIHNNKYDYSLSKYEGRFFKTTIICPKHGKFIQTIGDHLQGCGCPNCFDINTSSYELEIKEWIQEKYKKEILTQYRIENKEIDIYLPDLNLGIEINGSYWHSHLFKEKNYHFNKNKHFHKYGIQVFHIWEHDLLNPIKKKIIKSILFNKLKLNIYKIYARKCIIKEIPSKIYKNFCIENHIQGHSPANIKIGLFFQDNLVSCMSFSTLRMNLGNNNSENEWELVRFCSLLNTTVIGGANKLLSYFEKTYKPKSIVSYANEDYSQGNLYRILGFEDKGISNITYNYFNPKTLEFKNRFCYRKSELIKQGYNKEETEFEITHKMGLYRIYNAGTRKFFKHIYNKT